jgi:hypothetical protein
LLLHLGIIDHLLKMQFELVGDRLRNAFRPDTRSGARQADIAKADLGVAEANRDLAANQVDVATVKKMDSARLCADRCPSMAR